MATIVHIETSTEVCSVALSQDGQCIWHDENRQGHSHARILAPFVEEAVSMADSHAIPLDAVSFSAGPGSYTGLRIGLSTAKGLCFGRNLKLLSVDTLKLMCVPLLLYRQDIAENALLCPMIDARRMEVYAALYDRALKEVRKIGADIISEESYSEFLERGPVVFFGNGMNKCRKMLAHPNAIFIDNIEPLAKNMVPLAEKKFLQGQFEDTAYYEPFYLKEFQAGESKRLF